jgi:hypothetical protein
MVIPIVCAGEIVEDLFCQSVSNCIKDASHFDWTEAEPHDLDTRVFTQEVG